MAVCSLTMILDNTAKQLGLEAKLWVLSVKVFQWVKVLAVKN